MPSPPKGMLTALQERSKYLADLVSKKKIPKITYEEFTAPRPGFVRTSGYGENVPGELINLAQLENLSKEDISLLSKYTAGSFMERDELNRLATVLSSSQLPVPTSIFRGVHRGMSAHTPRSTIPREFPQSFSVEPQASLDFSSSSNIKDPESLENMIEKILSRRRIPVMYRMDAPKGAPALPVWKISDYPREREVLVSPKSRLKIKQLYLPESEQFSVAPNVSSAPGMTRIAEPDLPDLPSRLMPSFFADVEFRKQGGGIKNYADGGSVSPAPYLRNVKPRQEITPNLLRAVAQTESSFNPAAKSPKGALGLMQFMKPTSKDLAIDPLDPQQAVTGARTYLSWLLSQTGNLPDALASYNLGIGAFKKLGGKNLPKETEDYVKKVLARMGKQEQAIPDSIVSQPHNPVDPIKPPEPQSEELAAIPSDAPSPVSVSTPAQPSPEIREPESNASLPPSGAVPVGGGTGLGRRLSLPAAPTVPSIGDKDEDSPMEMVEKLLQDPLRMAKGYKEGGKAKDSPALTQEQARARMKEALARLPSRLWAGLRESAVRWPRQALDFAQLPASMFLGTPEERAIEQRYPAQYDISTIRPAPTQYGSPFRMEDPANEALFAGEWMNPITAPGTAVKPAAIVATRMAKPAVQGALVRMKPNILRGM